MPRNSSAPRKPDPARSERISLIVLRRENEEWRIDDTVTYDDDADWTNTLFDTLEQSRAAE